MTKVRFSDEEDEKLIQMVCGHEFLWDTKNHEFKNSFKKEDTWKEIGRTLSKTRNECQKRWKSIRDHHRRQRKEDCTGAKKKRASYWDKLKFLDTAEKNNFPNVFVEIHEKDSREGTPSVQLDEEHTVDNIIILPSNEDEMPSHQPEQTAPRPAAFQSSTPKRRRENSAIIQYFLEKMDDKASLSNCGRELAKPEEQDEIDLFFKSMAMTVKKFRPEIVTQAKMKVFEIITDMDLLNQKGPSPNKNLRCRK